MKNKLLNDLEKRAKSKRKFSNPFSILMSKRNLFRTNVISFILANFLCFNLLQAQPPSHDPSTMMRNTDGRYWIFTTGQGVWCMSSSNTNFTDWRAESTPFGSGWPSWINNYVSGFSGSFWAPDVIKIGSYYYLYYSCSTFGSSRSAIGVTRATNLSGPWSDQGVVVSSNGGSTVVNAIDPGMFRDTDGRVYMAYGSWFGGINVIEINTSTGKTTGSATKIAGGNGQDIEAPFILKNGSYYYLFVNRGNCCQGVNSTYYIQVARSTSVRGPYSGWRTFLSSSGRYIGPGHIGYGEGKLTYHYYDGQDNGAAKLMITTLGWSSDGWPIAGGSSSSSNIVSGGTYRITPRHSGKAIDVENCGTSDGTNIRQWSWLNNNCQQFVFTDAGSGYWRISPANATSKAMDLANCSGSNSANIQIWSWLNNDCQKWQMVDLGNGYYQIKSKTSGKCLDVANRSTADGANIIQYTCYSSSTNQQFALTRTKSSEAENSFDIVSEFGSKGFSLYPNPANSILNITLPDEYINGSIVQIFNNTGQVVYSGLGSASLWMIDISNLPNGIYILSINNGIKVLTKKFVKQ